MKKNKKDDEEVKTDLKHDTMEFVDEASENESEIDNPKDEEDEEITPEELDVLNDDKTDNQAYALNSAETGREQDEDNLPEEDWTEDIPEVNNEGEDDDEKKEEYRR